MLVEVIRNKPFHHYHFFHHLQGEILSYQQKIAEPEENKVSARESFHFKILFC